MPTDSDFSRLEANFKDLSSHDRLAALHEDVGEIKAALKEMTAAITKLALVEQQQAYATQAQERAFEAIANMNTRVVAIEQQMPLLTRSNVWLERTLLGASGAAFMFIAKNAGFFN
jgi:hypothetical protein